MHFAVYLEVYFTTMPPFEFWVHRQAITLSKQRSAHPSTHPPMHRRQRGWLQLIMRFLTFQKCWIYFMQITSLNYNQVLVGIDACSNKVLQVYIKCTHTHTHARILVLIIFIVDCWVPQNLVILGWGHFLSMVLGDDALIQVYNQACYDVSNNGIIYSNFMSIWRNYEFFFNFYFFLERKISNRIFFAYV